MEPNELIRIFIADDHALFRDGLTRLLEADPAFRVVGQASDGAEALRQVTELRPDLLLLDLSMPTTGGLEVLKALPTDSSLRVIVLTAGADDHVVIDALKYGARGILLKEAATPLLYKCIHCVMRGQYWLGRDNVADLVETLRAVTVNGAAPANGKAAFRLTPRELDIVAGVAAGESNREIAERLAVREHTVKHHLTNIFDKTGVFSRLELAVFAINHGLTEGDPRRP